MSHQSSRSNRRASSTFDGIPTFTAVGIIAAALFTGLLISWNTHTVGWPFYLLFVVASIVAPLLVNPKGLYLTVVSIPILFGFFIVITGWVVNRSDLPEGGDPFSTTSLVFSAYPLVQGFPTLLVGLIGGLAIAVVRLWLLSRYNKQVLHSQQSWRTRAAEDNQRNRRIAQRARARSNQVTVQELLERNSARGRSTGSTSTRRRRPVERLNKETPSSRTQSPRRSLRDGRDGS
ncbi:DUF6542 domain-containing protein [Corynebacterium cystitidis]|uniref:DUF6542 domain-containing protein n=1 Tax=Corynebacterium cystitidis TaxID=35757 RepID=UPI00211EE099|nr:DUF6542 domain-containing protein [Corynebacterium cystitidis]